jgi:hypothetical protein
VLGAGGGLASFAAAYYGVDLLKVTFGTALRRVGEVVVGTRVLVFSAVVALTTGLLSAFVPAWQLTGRDANDALKTGPGRGNSSSGDNRLRTLLVVSEVAFALMLLIGAGLLMRSLSGLRAVDPGFDPGNVLTATVDIPEAKYATPEQRNRFFERALQNVGALPGVESAAWVDTLPLQVGSTQYVMADGMPPMKDGIRLALGAPVGGVLRLIVVEGLKPTLIGVALGLALAAALVRVMTTLLYGVSQHDPGTFSAVALIMLGVGIVATLVPAYRATQVDPIVTLRSE